MRVLLLGATGNLGSRLIPALLAHRHTVTVYVRSPDKLRGLISTALYDNITITTGDAMDSAAVEAAIRANNCDAIVNTAGNRMPSGQEQILGKIAASVTSAAIRVGRERGKPFRAWLIGGLGSLKYPGTEGWKLQDYMFDFMSAHHKQTEAVLKAIPTTDLQWSLLCVAFMKPASINIDVLESPRGNSLSIATGTPPAWRNGWVKYIPFIGRYLNIIGPILGYTTKLEDVADLIAADLANSETRLVGELVAMKEVEQKQAL
ncbi:hypothetical protein LTR10_009645 [Elasticomyces elasticus]|nr:hypothetical protein LTR10_009645 [Elasticomyces elasticus]KAK4969937.1 hypothetical protein LTR42_008103 [Elasticomyces elasticus]